MYNRLKEILDSRGIKYGWLADQLGVDRNTVSDLINKYTMPSLKRARDIAKILGLSDKDIWPEEEESQP